MKWYYWLVIIGFLVIMYVMMISRQKKQEKQMQELMKSFKVGDKVFTQIGVYGKIKRIYNSSYGRVCVLEIDDKNKVEIELDMRCIAGIDEKVLMPDEPEEDKTPETKKEEVPTTKPVEDDKTTATEENKQTKKSKKSKQN